MKNRKIYFSDFETITKNGRAQITSWAIRNIDESGYTVGEGIDSYFEALFELPTASKVWVNELNFKGRFMTYRLEELGYEFIERNRLNSTSVLGNYLNCLIDASGSWFNINIKKGNKRITIVDASKKIPLKTNEVAIAYGVEFTGNKVKDTVNVWLTAISKHISEGLIANTISADAISKYKEIVGLKKFNLNFPQLDKKIDLALRNSYHGAFNFTKEKESSEGIVLDIVSMYPYIMSSFPLPCGNVRILEGNRIKVMDPERYAQFFEVSVVAVLKPEHIPSAIKPVILSNDRFYEVLNGQRLTMTYYDLELLKSQYDIDTLTIHKQYVFNASKTLFKDYIEKFYKIKKNAKDGGSRQVAKLMLNSLYGKFGQNLLGLSKLPTSEGYRNTRNGSPSTLYVPMAAYITSIGRYLIINAAQLNYENFNYSDTDSLHLSCTLEEVVKGDFIRIGDNLGDYNIEYVFKRAKYLKTKVYYLDGYDGTNKITIAGLRKESKDDISYRSFNIGLVIHNGSCRTTPIKGGCEKRFGDFKLGS